MSETLSCYKCHGSHSLQIEKHESFEPFIKVFCPKCALRWMHCSLCLTKGNYRVFATCSDIGSHRRYHFNQSNQKRKGKDVNDCLKNDFNDLLNDGNYDRNETTHVREASFENFRGVKRQFFELQNDGKGGEHIVSLSQFGESMLSNKISKIETDLHLNLAYLLNKTSVNTHEIILSVINTLTKINNEKNEAGIKKRNMQIKRPVMWETHIPETLSDCRRMYTIGKNSIINNIPIPDVELLQDHLHSYISLKDIIADINGYGTDIERIIGGRVDVPRNVRYLKDSKLIGDIKSKAPGGVFINAIIEWSDDCEGNRGSKKSGSIWMKNIKFIDHLIHQNVLITHIL